MAMPHLLPILDYRRSTDQDASPPVRRPVVVVGAGPTGLSLAIDLALQGVPVVLLDDGDTVSPGSRAVCYAKRTLEVWDRLGIGEAVAAEGVHWRRGWVHHGNRLVYEFDLLTEPGHKVPAFTNLPQCRLEEALIARAHELDGIELRWRNRVTGLNVAADHVALQVDTPEGPYELQCDWLVAADGAKSFVRQQLGLDFVGQTVRDRFLVCDVATEADFPNLRHFWFDPPFHRDRSVLMHRQGANLWRIDLQLGWYADVEAELAPERVATRLRRILGERAEFRVESAEIYTFQCRRLGRFVHGRVLFAGDAAHQVSPFGARGANSSVQDADNLGWKLRLVLAGLAPVALLESYDRERVAAADENLRAAAQAAEFIAPQAAMARVLRDAALHLAERFSFARDFVNSGRLSQPHIYRDSPLTTPDNPADRFAGGVQPGAPCMDAPMERQGRADWLLHHLQFRFIALVFDAAPPSGQIRHLASLPVPVHTVSVRSVPEGVAAEATTEAACLADTTGLARDRYDAQPGTTYLVRPDQHVAARWRHFDPSAIAAALARATGSTEAA